MRLLESKNGFNDKILLLNECKLAIFNFWSSVAKHCSCDDLINLINVEFNSAVLIGPVCLSKGDVRQFEIKRRQQDITRCNLVSVENYTA